MNSGLITVIVSGVLLGLIYALFAAGLTIALGIMKVFNVAYGALITLVIIEVAQLFPDGPLILLILSGIGIGALLGAAVEVVGIRPLRRRGLTPEKFSEATFLTCLAVMLAVGGLNVIETDGGDFKKFPTSEVMSGNITIAGVNLQSGYIVGAAVAIVIIIACAWTLARTQVGRSLRAIAADADMAELLGINVTRYSLGASAITGALAGLSGVLLASILTSFDVTFGDTFLLRGFAIVVLAGLGRITGALAAGVILGVSETLLGYYGGSGWSMAGAMLLIAVILVVRPNGLFGRAGAERA